MLTLLNTQGSSPDDAPIVTDPDLGQIRGVHMDTLFGKPFSAFKGIPYVQKLEPKQRYAVSHSEKYCMHIYLFVFLCATFFSTYSFFLILLFLFYLFLFLYASFF